MELSGKLKLSCDEMIKIGECFRKMENLKLCFGDVEILLKAKSLSFCTNNDNISREMNAVLDLVQVIEFDNTIKDRI